MKKIIKKFRPNFLAKNKMTEIFLRLIFDELSDEL